MIKRKKIYYSENEIEKNLYTAGKEYMDMDNNEYIGHYHKYIKTGEVFTELEYNTNKSKKLKPYLTEISNKAIKQYLGTVKDVEELPDVTFIVPNNLYKPNQYVAPIQYHPKPTPDEYKVGVMNRYFLKKRNARNGKILEVNKKTYDLTTEKGPIDGNLWKRYTLKWRISGPINDIKNKANIVISPGISSTNRRILKKAESEFSGITSYLSNVIQFGKVK